MDACTAGKADNGDRPDSEEPRVPRRGVGPRAVDVPPARGGRAPRVARRGCLDSGADRAQGGGIVPARPAPRPWPRRPGCRSRWPSRSRPGSSFNERIVKAAPPGGAEPPRSDAAAGDPVGQPGGLRDQRRGPADLQRASSRALAADRRACGRPRGRGRGQPVGATDPVRARAGAGAGRSPGPGRPPAGRRCREGAIPGSSPPPRRSRCRVTTS